MRIRIALTTVALALVASACTSAPGTDPAAPTPGVESGSPFAVVDEAEKVADQVEQRQADLEQQLAELSDPFSQP